MSSAFNPELKKRLVKDTLRILNIPKQRYKKPLVVLFVGPTASGKTMVAKEIEKRLPFCRLTADVIRAFIVPSPTFHRQETNYLYSLLESVLLELVGDGVNVLYDTNLAKYSQRQKVRRMIEGLGGRVFLIHVTCKESRAFERIKKRNEELQKGLARGRIIDRELYRFVVNSIEPPHSDEDAFMIDTSYTLRGFGNLILRLKKSLKNPKA